VEEGLQQAQGQHLHFQNLVGLQLAAPGAYPPAAAAAAAYVEAWQERLRWQVGWKSMLRLQQVRVEGSSAYLCPPELL